VVGVIPCEKLWSTIRREIVLEQKVRAHHFPKITRGGVTGGTREKGGYRFTNICTPELGIRELHRQPFFINPEKKKSQKQGGGDI